VVERLRKGQGLRRLLLDPSVKPSGQQRVSTNINNRAFFHNLDAFALVDTYHSCSTFVVLAFSPQHPLFVYINRVLHFSLSRLFVEQIVIIAGFLTSDLITCEKGNLMMTAFRTTKADAFVIAALNSDEHGSGADHYTVDVLPLHGCGGTV